MSCPICETTYAQLGQFKRGNVWVYGLISYLSNMTFIFDCMLVTAIMAMFSISGGIGSLTYS